MAVRVIILSFLLTMISTVHAFSEFTVETFPDSIKNPGACDLSSSGLACDPDRLLKRFNDTVSGADYLAELSNQIRYNTNCSCLEQDEPYGYCPATKSHGYTVSSAIMKSIRMNFAAGANRQQVLPIFADALRRRQHRGYCDDDVLIVVIADWKTAWTAVGVVAERLLTPDIVTEVNKEAEQLFTNGDYLGGLTLMVERYELILMSDGQNLEEHQFWHYIRSRFLRSWLIILLGLLVVVSFVILVTLIIIRFCCNERRTYLVGRPV